MTNPLYSAASASDRKKRSPPSAVAIDVETTGSGGGRYRSLSRAVKKSRVSHVKEEEEEDKPERKKLSSPEFTRPLFINQDDVRIHGPPAPFKLSWKNVGISTPLPSPPLGMCGCRDGLCLFCINASTLYECWDHRGRHQNCNQKNCVNKKFQMYTPIHYQVT